MESKKRDYDEVSVVQYLSKKKGCDVSEKSIKIDSNQSDIGNASWGRIDYLCKMHGYTYIVVDGLPKKQYSNKKVNPLKDVTNIKQIQGQPVKPKFDMAGMTRLAMKNNIVNKPF